MKKVTKEIFDSVRVNSKDFKNDIDDLMVISGLSKRTIKNIIRAENYSDYRKKYCSNKDKSVIHPKCEFNVSEDMSLYFFGELTVDHKLINKLILINLIINVIGLSIIIAMIAW